MSLQGEMQNLRTDVAATGDIFNFFLSEPSQRIRQTDLKSPLQKGPLAESGTPTFH